MRYRFLGLRPGAFALGANGVDDGEQLLGGRGFRVRDGHPPRLRSAGLRLSDSAFERRGSVCPQRPSLGAEGVGRLDFEAISLIAQALGDDLSELSAP